MWRGNSTFLLLFDTIHPTNYHIALIHYHDPQYFFLCLYIEGKNWLHVTVG